MQLKQLEHRCGESRRLSYVARIDPPISQAEHLALPHRAWDMTDAIAN